MHGFTVSGWSISAGSSGSFFRPARLPAKGFHILTGYFHTITITIIHIMTINNCVTAYIITFTRIMPLAEEVAVGGDFGVPRRKQTSQ